MCEEKCGFGVWASFLEKMIQFGGRDSEAMRSADEKKGCSSSQFFPFFSFLLFLSFVAGCGVCEVEGCGGGRKEV